MKPVRTLNSVVLPAPLAEDSCQLSALQRKGHVPYGGKAAEPFRDLPYFEQLGHRRRAVSRRQVGATRPPGRKNRMSDRHDHRKQRRADLELIVGVKRSAEPGEGGADHERCDLVEGHIDAGGLAGRFVAADRAQQQAPMRVRQ
jgi:hypothetical protein